MMMYYNQNDDNDKFTLMWFIDFGDAVYGVTTEQHDADKNDVSNASEDHGK